MKTILTALILLISLNFFAQDVPDKYQDIWTECNEGDPEKVHKKLDKLIKKNPNDPWLYWMKGNVGYSENPENVLLFKKSLEVDSTFAPAYYSLASYYLGENQIDANVTEDYYNKAIYYYPEDAFYLASRGSFYLSQNRNEEALRDSYKAFEMNNEAATLAFPTIVYALSDLNKKDELKQFLTKFEVLNYGLEPPFYYIFVGNIYEEFDMHTKACNAYKLGLQEIENSRILYENSEFEDMFSEQLISLQEKLKACN
jgi:tetratricopeptide (TPR) repeat protein